jgi:murein DD-endopeptidase MepM/ murein hydrolase activator NlpD
MVSEGRDSRIFERTIRQSQATPDPKLLFQREARLIALRWSAASAVAHSLAVGFLLGVGDWLLGLVGLRGLRLVLNTSVAVLVLSLPFAAGAASRASSTTIPTLAVSASADVSRAQSAARAIAAGRNPVTVAAPGTRPIQEVTVHEGDTLATMANYYDVSVEAIAFASGVTDPSAVRIGDTLVIPPAEGALYTVVEGDTVESVASRFNVDPSVIKSYNRLYFEPEHFAPGQLIFVRGAALPALRAPERPSRILAGPSTPALAAQSRTGSLTWPVGGVITQYFWSGHTGVDLAAPYGTGIGAAADGVVTATGWVAVGGLRVCVQHAGNLTTCYYHTSAVYVSVGQQVSRGQIIAAIGLTGVTTGPHVHWECQLGSQFVSCLSL